MTKNRFMKFLLIALFLFGGVLAAIAFWIEPQSLAVRTINVQSPNWKSKPIKIALIADVHIDGYHMTHERVQTIIAKTKMLKPDLVILAGDYSGGMFSQSHPPGANFENRTVAENHYQASGIAEISMFKEIAPLGMIAVMGNHDCWWSCEKVRESFRQNGSELLENDSRHIIKNGFNFWVTGLEDHQTQSPNYRDATQKIPKDASIITVSHNPAEYKPYISHSKIHLAGHLHRGQVRFPFIGAPITSGAFTEETKNGFMIEGDRILIVSGGLGSVGLPVRFGAPPEIVIINLTQGQITKADFSIL